MTRYGACEFIGYDAKTLLPVHEYRSFWNGKWWTIGERVVYTRPPLAEDHDK